MRLVLGLPLALVGCSFSASGSTDGPVSVITDGGADAQGVVAWSLHTSAELADPGVDPSQLASITDGRIARDLVEPVAWTIGGLLVRASDTSELTDPTASWTTVSALPPTASRAVAWPVGDFYGATFPAGLGLTDPDHFTVWAEGEIFLEAGQHTFALDVDDAGFLEIDADGNHRLEDTWFGLDPVDSFDVAVDGWYPIRAAMGEVTVDAWWRVRHDPPGAAPDAPLAPERLRYPASDLTGVGLAGFDSEELGRRRGETLLAAPLVDQSYANATPADLGLTNGDNLTQRFAGQFWVDAAGEASATVTSDDGSRLAIDGTWLYDDLVGNPASHDVGPLALDRGWHDIVLDHQDKTGDAAISFRFAGATVPSERLRPAVSTRERIAVAASTTGPVLIPGSLDVRLSAPADAELVDMTIVLDAGGAHWNDDTVDLHTPWGATIRVRDHQSANGAVVTDRLDATALGSAGHALAGTWSIAIDDTSGGNDGTLGKVDLTVRYRGGAPAIAQLATYTSGVHDFGAPRQVSGVVVAASTPAGSSASIAIRTCDALPCAGAFAPAASFPLPAARYAQLQVVLTSDGVVSPFIDDIDVYALP